jgi:hypothetical protein
MRPVAFTDHDFRTQVVQHQQSADSVRMYGELLDKSCQFAICTLATSSCSEGSLQQLQGASAKATHTMGSAIWLLLAVALISFF